MQCSSSINPCKVERKMATSSKRHENCNSQLQFTIRVKSDEKKIRLLYSHTFNYGKSYITCVHQLTSSINAETGYKASEYLSPNFSLKAVADQLGEAALREKLGLRCTLIFWPVRHNVGCASTHSINYTLLLSMVNKSSVLMYTRYLCYVQFFSHSDSTLSIMRKKRGRCRLHRRRRVAQVA